MHEPNLTAIMISFAICITFIASHGCHQVMLTKREAIKNGLQEKQLQGTTMTAWQKP